MSQIDLLKNMYPRQTKIIQGSPFPYRYYKNEQSNQTVVLLTGGIGLSDLMLFHFREFAQSYSVLAFDYPPAYATLQQLVDAIAELLQELEVKAFLIGQSLGGFIAQIVAQQHPQVVAGLILSNTGTLSVHLDGQAAQSLYNLTDKIDRSLFLVKLLPFSLTKKAIRKGIMKVVGQQMTPPEQAIMTEFCDEIEKTLTKEYELHMIALLKDLQQHWNMRESDFERYRGRVLLILSDDDSTFSEGVKQALIDLMPNPAVITDLRGGHLALLLRLDRYVQAVKEFMAQADGEADG